LLQGENLGASPQFGILEEWNTGIMGLKEQKRPNSTFSAFMTHDSIIPPFHYSMYRVTTQSLKKTHLTPIGCRNSETSSYE